MSEEEEEDEEFDIKVKTKNFVVAIKPVLCFSPLRNEIFLLSLSTLCKVTGVAIQKEKRKFYQSKSCCWV